MANDSYRLLHLQTDSALLLDLMSGAPSFKGEKHRLMWFSDLQQSEVLGLEDGPVQRKGIAGVTTRC